MPYIHTSVQNNQGIIASASHIDPTLPQYNFSFPAFSTSLFLSHFSRSVQRLERHIQRHSHDRHLRLRFVIQNLLDLVQDFRSQLRENLERFEVIDDLLGPRSAQDDSASVGLLGYPGEGEVMQLATEFCDSEYIRN